MLANARCDIGEHCDIRRRTALDVTMRERDRPRKQVIARDDTSSTIALVMGSVRPRRAEAITRFVEAARLPCSLCHAPRRRQS
ncbi:Hypothetical protein A7982_03585 [Minicystis rosea]|nr:Hypothetical protein A7982_03585 [Minicystis rosea]